MKLVRGARDSFSKGMLSPRQVLRKESKGGESPRNPDSTTSPQSIKGNEAPPAVPPRAAHAAAAHAAAAPASEPPSDPFVESTVLIEREDVRMALGVTVTNVKDVAYPVVATVGGGAAGNPACQVQGVLQAGDRIISCAALTQVQHVDWEGDCTDIEKGTIEMLKKAVGAIKITIERDGVVSTVTVEKRTQASSLGIEIESSLQWKRPLIRRVVEGPCLGLIREGDKLMSLEAPTEIVKLEARDVTGAQIVRFLGPVVGGLRFRVHRLRDEAQRKEAAATARMAEEVATVATAATPSPAAMAAAVAKGAMAEAAAAEAAAAVAAAELRAAEADEARLEAQSAQAAARMAARMAGEVSAQELVIAKAVAATAVSTALVASKLTATSAAVKEVPPPSAKEVPPPSVKEVPPPSVKEVPPPSAKEVPPPSAKSASLLAAEHEARLAAKAVEASQLRSKAMHEAWLKQQTDERQSLPSAYQPAPSVYCESPLVYAVARCFGCQ